MPLLSTIQPILLILIYNGASESFGITSIKPRQPYYLLHTFMIGWPKNIWAKSKGEVNANVMKWSCHVSPADVLTPDPWFILFCCLSPLSPLFIKTTLRFSQAVLNVNMGNKKENSGVTASHNCTSDEWAESVMKCKGSHHGESVT